MTTSDSDCSTENPRIGPYFMTLVTQATLPSLINVRNKFFRDAKLINLAERNGRLTFSRKLLDLLI